MEQHTIHKTYKYKLKPTPIQERELERVLMLCRWLYNTVLEQRITAWQRRRVSVSRFEQKAELKDIRAAFPDVRVLHTPDRDYQFRSVMSRKTVAHMLANKVEQIDYDNLKDSVADDERHDAYLEIWTTMMQWSKGWFRPKPKMKAKATRSVILPSVASDA